MRVLLLLISVALVSCAASVPPAPGMLTTPRPPIPILATPPRAASALVFTGSTARSVGEALHEALQTPQAWRFQGGILVYTVVPGARYRIDLAIDRLTTLRFAPGEVLFTTVSGLPNCADLKTEDPEVNVRCLTIHETISGEGSTQQANIAIRPGSEGLRTNVMVTTAWGPYDIEVVSTKGRYIPVVQWERPQPTMPVAEFSRQEIIGVGYAMVSRRASDPSWMPTAMWDDTKHTYLRFPSTIGAVELPVLYEVSADTMAETLVNYRVTEDSQLLIADGVFDAAVLRVGKDPEAQLVDLRRTSGYQYLRCPGEGCPTWPDRRAGR